MADDRRSIDQQRMLPPEFEQGASRVDDLFARPVSLTPCRPPSAVPAITRGAAAIESGEATSLSVVRFVEKCPRTGQNRNSDHAIAEKACHERGSAPAVVIRSRLESAGPVTCRRARSLSTASRRDGSAFP